MIEYFNLTFENRSIEVQADVEKPSGLQGQYEGGSIELKSIKYEGAELLWLFEECNKEEEIIDLIRKQIN